MLLARPLQVLAPDGRTLFATKAVRAFAMGMLSVVLALYLGALGYSSVEIGVFLTLSLLGEVIWTIALTTVADRMGRRKMLQLGAGLMAISGFALAAAPPLGILVPIAFLGAVSPTGKDTGPTLAIEQAALPQTTPPEHRTAVFAWYNLMNSFAGALGALAAALPAVFQGAGATQADSFRPLVVGYAACAVVLWALFTRLTSAVEPPRATGPGGPMGTEAKVGPTSASPTTRQPQLGLHRSRSTVVRLSLLFGVDAFAGGFIVQSLVAYWFHLRYGFDAALLGGIFFAANTLSGLSFLAAAPLARRIGLINTMVFTHLPSNVLLLLVPFMPTPELAVIVFIFRHALSQMDVPTRQSYTMAVVDPNERSAAAGFTTVARSVAAAASPALVGQALQTAAFAVPFVAAGVLKIAYDLTLWVSFRSRRAPGERR